MTKRNQSLSAKNSVHCTNCNHNMGYYSKLGVDYSFTCRYCGIERNSKGDTPAIAVLEIVHGNNYHEFAIIRKAYTVEEIRQIVMPYKLTIVSAELRTIKGREVSAIPLLKYHLIRSSIASIVYKYDWLVGFVCGFIEWRCNGKANKRKQHY